MRTLILALAATMCALSAQATTYVSSHAVGSGAVDLSITTDDTVGVLGASNILDWTISVTNGATTFTLFGPESGDNSRVEIGGGALSATPTDLVFNFNATGNRYVLFQSTAGGRELYCVQSNGCFDYNGGEEIVGPGAFFTASATAARSGVQSLASVAVPEPATWAMLLLGFGSLGAVLRARRPREIATA